jgi:predicted dehydrogenase
MRQRFTPRDRTAGWRIMKRRHFLALGSAALAAAQDKSAAPLKAVVIGHTGRGDYGHGLDRIFSNRPGIELVALADADEAGRKKMAEALKVPRQYADYREMLEKEKPALVSVAMRQADQHRDIILAALKAGAHVYAEKPVTRSPAESDELIAAAEAGKLRVGVAHTMRQTKFIRRLRDAVKQEGLIGDLVEMRAYGKQDARAGGEDLMVLGSHLMDLLRMFAGDPLWCSARVLSGGKDITRADARRVKDDVGPVAGDEVFAQYAFPNGVNATFTSANRLRETTGHWGIELHGSKGVARINCDIDPNVFLRRTTAWTKAGRADTWAPFDPDAVKAPEVHKEDPVTDWLSAIRENREPECSLRNGAWAVEMVCAVYASALNGSRAGFPLKERKHPLEG